MRGPASNQGPRNRAAKDKRTTQYFEMFCNRAIYHEGWVACSHFGNPWDTASRGGDFLKAPRELYNIDEDFSQTDASPGLVIITDVLSTHALLLRHSLD